ncbi:MAG: zinc-dependent metalloprotease [Saprospiraceae bacterium]|nr:zinc-dependent metalloprotease [Saprospiraceae bacterium]
MKNPRFYLKTMIISMLRGLFLMTIMTVYSKSILGQQSILKLNERLFGSQYYESMRGIRYDIRDSLADEISRLDINSIPQELSFQLKFHDFTTHGLVTEQMIIEQMEVINNAFNRIDTEHFIQNENLEAFYSLAAVPNFKFCYDAEISRKELQNDHVVDKYLFDKIAGYDPTQVNESQIHVYIIELKDKFVGIATPPHLNSDFNGIIIDHRFFGIKDASEHSYNGGKTIVHLLANYLGLSELWNEESPCSDDFVDDTPIHNYANFTIGTNYKNVSTCDGHPIEMIVNYMDNLPDELLTMFTKGQVERLRKIAYSKFGRKNKINLSCQFEAAIRASEVGYKLYPNPNTGEFVLIPSKELEAGQATVFDMYGKKVLSLEFSSVDSTAGLNFNISDYPTGIYYIKLCSQNEECIVRKIVKK